MLIARAAAIVLALFLGLFAADAFHEGSSTVDTVTNVLLHVLPALAVLAILAVAWRRPILGAVLYFLLAVLSVALFRRRLSGLVFTTLPLVVIAGLFLWSALAGRGTVRGTGG